jgi:hemolysin activation/secretion protein
LKIVVQRFQINGNTLVPESKLQPLLERHQGQDMSFSEIEAMVSELTEIFKDAGWIVRAYLPDQDVLNGVVHIQIVQARFGQVLMDGEIPKPATPESLTRIIQSQQTSGTFLNSPAIDRALLIADDISGVYVNGNLKEGEQDSETDLVLKATPKPRIDGSALTDNTGSRGTGINRLMVSLNINSVVADGDQISNIWTETKASRYGRVGWTLPVGTDGLKIGANTSHLAYSVLQFEGAFAPTGTSDTKGMEASYPLIRSRSQNLYASFAMDEKHFKNYSEGQVKSDYQSRTKSLSFYGNSFDDWGGGGSNTGNLTFVNGFMNMDGSPNAAEVALTTQTGGAYRKIRYALSRQQVLVPEWSAYGSVSGQRARAGKNLDSSEKFYLGGSSGVRAYPSSEAGGGNGVMGNLELRWQMQPRLMLASFYDVGHVTLYPSLNQQDVTALNSYRLKGRGFSLAWQSEEGMSFKMILARRIGNNPAANIETGKDLDGSLVRTRLWSSLTLPY